MTTGYSSAGMSGRRADSGASKRNLYGERGSTCDCQQCSIGSGEVGVTIWVGDMCFVGANVQEGEVVASGFPQTGDVSDVQAAEVRDLEKRGSGDCTQGSGNTDNGDVN